MKIWNSFNDSNIPVLRHDGKAVRERSTGPACSRIVLIRLNSVAIVTQRITDREGPSTKTQHLHAAWDQTNKAWITIVTHHIGVVSAKQIP